MIGQPSAIALDVSLCALLAADVRCLLSYRRQRRELAEFVAQLIGRRVGEELEAAFKIATYIFSNIRRGPDPYFSRFFRSFGASPISILHRGGCCSGLHRLFITSLETIGIRSAQITLYTLTNTARHCLAQVFTRSGPHIIDVYYGLHYRDPQGGVLGLMDLRNGALPVLAPIPSTINTVPYPATGYPPGDYHSYDFALTRTANWTKSWRRKSFYKLLRTLTTGRVDSALLPPILEWPQILLAICITVGALGVLLLRVAMAA